MTAIAAATLLRRCRLRGALLIALSPLSALLVAPAPAGAASLQARAAAITAEIELDQADLTAIGERYVAQSTALSTARARANAGAAAIHLDEGRVLRERLALQQSAVDAYISAGATSPAALFITSGVEQALTGRTYLDVADSHLDGEEATLAVDEHRLGVLVDTQEQLAQEISVDIESTEAAHASALQTLGAERSALSTVQGELAALVAAQEAAAQRAAAQAAATKAAAGPADPGASAAPSLAGILTSSSPAASGSVAQSLAGLRNCESSGNYGEDSGNGYYGAYQFSAGTWAAYGGGGLASQATPAQQDAAAVRLYQRQGFSPWPGCAALLGL